MTDYTSDRPRRPVAVPDETGLDTAFSFPLYVFPLVCLPPCMSIAPYWRSVTGVVDERR
jgi:hypothetical protein